MQIATLIFVSLFVLYIDSTSTDFYFIQPKYSLAEKLLATLNHAPSLLFPIILFTVTSELLIIKYIFYPIYTLTEKYLTYRKNASILFSIHDIPYASIKSATYNKLRNTITLTYYIDEEKKEKKTIKLSLAPDMFFSSAREALLNQLKQRIAGKEQE